MEKKVIHANISVEEFEARGQEIVIKTSGLFKRTVFENMSGFHGQRIFLGSVQSNQFKIYSKPYFPGPDFFKTSFIKLWSIWVAPVIISGDIKAVSNGSIDLYYKVQKEPVVLYTAKIFLVFVIMFYAMSLFKGFSSFGDFLFDTFTDGFFALVLLCILYVNKQEAAILEDFLNDLVKN